MSGNKFNQLVNREGRAGTGTWVKIECIQTCIKHKNGVGEIQKIHFFAPINPRSPNDEISFDYRQFAPDLELLHEGRDFDYCWKQCLKMAYYISTIRGIEILMMQAEFSKDENGYIWFFYAHNVHVREVPNKKTLNSKDAKREAKKIAENKEKVRQTMIQELQ